MKRFIEKKVHLRTASTTFFKFEKSVTMKC